MFARNEVHAIIIIVLYSMQQCNNNGFIHQYPKLVRGTSKHSLVSGNYPQDVLGDLVMWELVVLLMIYFNTSSFSFTVLSQIGNREVELNSLRKTFQIEYYLKTEEIFQVACDFTYVFIVC